MASTNLTRFAAAGVLNIFAAPTAHSLVVRLQEIKPPPQNAATCTAENLAQAVMSTPDVACYGDGGGTIHVSHEKQRLDAPEAASIGRATRTSRSRERVRTSHPHYGARSSF